MREEHRRGLEAWERRLEERETMILARESAAAECEERLRQAQQALVGGATSPDAALYALRAVRVNLACGAVRRKADLNVVAQELRDTLDACRLARHNIEPAWLTVFCHCGSRPELPASAPKARLWQNGTRCTGGHPMHMHILACALCGNRTPLRRDPADGTVLHDAEQLMPHPKFAPYCCNQACPAFFKLWQSGRTNEAQQGVVVCR